jgi:hypothetical protein
VGRSLWREDGSVVYNCCWSSPAESFLGPNPVGLATIFYYLRFETSLFVAAGIEITMSYSSSVLLCCYGNYVLIPKQRFGFPSVYNFQFPYPWKPSFVIRWFPGINLSVATYLPVRFLETAHTSQYDSWFITAAQDTIKWTAHHHRTHGRTDEGIAQQLNLWTEEQQFLLLSSGNCHYTGVCVVYVFDISDHVLEVRPRILMKVATLLEPLGGSSGAESNRPGPKKTK